MVVNLEPLAATGWGGSHLRPPMSPGIQTSNLLVPSFLVKAATSMFSTRMNTGEGVSLIHRYEGPPHKKTVTRLVLL